ncbi:MAG: UDP-N-acetylmuramoyl-L-alanyl-D-glutamate--L-lysine ligase [Lactobacillales bacterium]|jgi:UDP-N-acetylmuramoyl-L-alanyl-D-glutamate-L-lysine ligase|nr:UDP-N-acetylmuramoyl-L-alanyl-D-glutamate--L-lysine ligase [Lactobacillales bacterium]
MQLTLSTIQDLLIKENLWHEIIINNDWHYTVPSAYLDKSFSSVSYDSRKVDKDTLFFVKGLNFKAEYLTQAIKAGLEVYIAEQPLEVEEKAIGIIVSDIKKAMATLSMAFYDYPQNDLKIIAFTGTKGKTTAAYFAKGILDVATNKKTAMLSTMNTTLDGVTYFKSKLTTPESLDLFQMLRTAVDNHMTHLIMEVSSQAYKTSRVYGLTFDVGIFLNISPDHIGPIEHPTFEDYFYCKRQLLLNSRQIVLNHDADYFNVLLEEAKATGKPVYIYGEEKHDTNAFFKTVANNHFSFQVAKGEMPSELKIDGEYSLRLAGDFNKGNALSAIIAASLTGATKADAVQGIANTTIPGRMELLKQANGATVYIDYAHNLISLQTLLAFVKDYHKGKIIVVLGSPGSKGLSRRKDFGGVLSKLADVAVLTTDDPDFENPADIAAEIQKYITSDVEVHTILAREEAILYALSLSHSSEDAVVLAGKGADLFQKVNGQNMPYLGDYEIARTIIQE